MYSLYILICSLMRMKIADAYGLLPISYSNVLKNPFGLGQGYQVFVGGPTYIYVAKHLAMY